MLLFTLFLYLYFHQYTDIIMILSAEEVLIMGAEKSWGNLNGISDDDKTCALNDMNCLGDEDASSCGLNDMNCVGDQDDLSCALDNMNCEPEEKK